MLSGKNTWKTKTAKYLISILLSSLHGTGITTSIAASQAILSEQSLPATQHLNEVNLIYHEDFPYIKPRNYQPIPECSLLQEKPERGHSLLRCTEHIKLLLPSASAAIWKKEQKQQGYINLHAKQITRDYVNTNIHAHIILIKPTRMGTEEISRSTNAHPVTALFIRHATNVRTYQFKNLQTGAISTINATTDHPFYSKNKKTFIPIGSASSSDRFTTDTGQEIRLICPQKKVKHCGTPYKNGQLTTVYNITTYLKHTYFVGKKDHILVHNCTASRAKAAQAMKRREGEEMVETEIAFEDIPKKTGIRFVVSTKYENHRVLQSKADTHWYKIGSVKGLIKKEGYDLMHPTIHVKVTHVKNFHDEQIALSEVENVLQNPRSGRFIRGYSSAEDIRESFPEFLGKYNAGLANEKSKYRLPWKTNFNLREFHEQLPGVYEHNLPYPPVTRHK